MKRPRLSEMTLREKIGQTALGHPTSPGCAQPERYPYGCMWGLGNLDMGVINMADRAGEKITDLPDWLKRMEQLNRRLPMPVLQANDSTTGIHECFQETHTLMDCVTIGATGSEELAFEAGVLRARLEKCVGGRWVWCPEIDLSNRRKGIMLGRQYSDDPDMLMRMALADMKGVQSQRVAATAKHFPGCDGLEYRDAHVCENMLVIPMDEWKATQGAMFQKIIDAGVDSIMIAHGAFPACDPTTRHGRYLPASVSKRVITDLLKGEMGFDGVVVTDAMDMGGFNGWYPTLHQTEIESFKAGCDMLLWPTPEYVDNLVAAVESGEVPMERLDDAVSRILRMKEKLGLFASQDARPLAPQEQAFVKDVARRTGDQSLTLLRDDMNLFPMSPDTRRRIAVIPVTHHQPAMQESALLCRLLRERGFDVDEYPEGITDAKTADYDLILYALFSRPFRPMGFLDFMGSEAVKVQRALQCAREKTLIVSFGSPYFAEQYFERALTVVNAYSMLAPSVEAFVRAAVGEGTFTRFSPVALRRYARGYGE